MKQHSNKQTNWQTSLKLTALAAILVLAGCGSVAPEPTAQPQVYINPCTATGPTPPAPLPSGSLDICTFGTGGKVTTGITNARAIALQSDGKIVVGGSEADSFGLARYDQSGSLDTSFGTGGKVKTGFGFKRHHINAIAIYPMVLYPNPGWRNSGKIVVAGTANYGSFSEDHYALARYNQSGSLDTSFDGDGITTLSLGGRDGMVSSVAIQSDGKIVMAGSYQRNSTDDDFVLFRYTNNGSLDTTFDGDGIVMTSINPDVDIARSVALQSDGKIVVAGTSYIGGSNSDFALVRYNPNGSLDTSFDGDGVVTTAIGSGREGASSVAIQSDGKIVAAGDSSNGSNHDFALVRYNSNGTLDTSFDGDGKATTDFGSSTDQAHSLAIQSNGKIVVAGYTNKAGNNNFALTRYNSSGSLDTSFGTGGKVTTAISSGSNDSVEGLAIQGDGKIVVVGNSYATGSTTYTALARYLP